MNTEQLFFTLQLHPSLHKPTGLIFIQEDDLFI